jgi:hypothetical protein
MHLSWGTFVPSWKNWCNVNQALRMGLRGLPGKDSLARLLQRERGHRHLHDLPPLSEGRIVAWAVAHCEATGNWPTENSGGVVGQSGENWAAINTNLRDGCRGLPGGDTLARLLARHGAENYTTISRLTRARIIAWARIYRKARGRWPSAGSPPVGIPEGERWKHLDGALRHGHRGLRGGSSLSRLLRRGDRAGGARRAAAVD